MADLPSLGDRKGGITRFGPPLLGVSVALFLLTRIIVWLPLGFVGSLINGVLWPVIVLSLLVGGVLTWRRVARD